MPFRKVTVSVPGAEYPVVIGEGARSALGRVLTRPSRPSRIHVVSDATVERRHGAKLRRELDALDIPYSTTVVPAGEGSKSPREISRVWRDLLRSGCDRSSVVVAFGGGVVGDLAGFAAASALRGIELVQVPTTLLAMVDASVGGKTGINLPEGKNLVGAFHQPRAVVMDLEFLRSLPAREFRAGCAEVIKTAAIWDAKFYRRLEREATQLLARDADELARAVASCVRIKAAVVAADEKEARLRMILNFGHTFGHGLEAAGRYRRHLHGEAVAIGMVFASGFAAEIGHAADETPPRIRDLVSRFGLPTSAEGFRAASVLRAMQRDKKRGASGLRWVFVPRIGTHKIVDDVPADDVERSVREFLRASGNHGRSTRAK